MSVRTKPSREALTQASKAYQEIRDGNPRKLRVVQGQIQRSGLQALRAPSLLWQLRLSATLVVLALVALDANEGGWMAGVAVLGAVALAYLMVALNSRVFSALGPLDPKCPSDGRGRSDAIHGASGTR